MATVSYLVTVARDVDAPVRPLLPEGPVLLPLPELVALEHERWLAEHRAPPAKGHRWITITGDGPEGVRGWRLILPTGPGSWGTEHADLWQIQPWLTAVDPMLALRPPGHSPEFAIADGSLDFLDAATALDRDAMHRAVLARHPSFEGDDDDG